MLIPDGKTIYRKVPNCWTVTVRNSDGSIFCLVRGETEQQAVRRAQNICHAIEEVFG